MDIKELNRRRDAYSIFDDLQVTKLLDFFKQPQILKVWKGNGQALQWSHPFFAEDIDRKSPWLVAIGREVDRVGHEFDCRDFVKGLLIQEVERDGKLTSDHIRVLTPLGFDLLGFRQQNEDGFIQWPDDVLPAELKHLSKTAEAQAWLKKLRTPWPAQLDLSESKLKSWTTAGLEKDRRPYSLWRLVEDWLMEIASASHISSTTLDLRNFLEIATLIQLDRTLSPPADLTAQGVLADAPGLKVWAKHYEFDYVKVYGDEMYTKARNLEKDLRKVGMNGGIILAPLFTQLGETSRFVENYLHSKADGNLILTFTFDEQPGRNHNAFTSALESCLRTFSAMFPRIQEINQTYVDEAEQVASNLYTGETYQIQAIAPVEDMGPSLSWMRSKLIISSS